MAPCWQIYCDISISNWRPSSASQATRLLIACFPWLPTVACHKSEARSHSRGREGDVWNIRRCWIHMKIWFLPKKKKNDEGDANLSRENLDYFGSLTHLCLASVIKGLPSGSVCLTFDRWPGKVRTQRGLRETSERSHAGIMWPVPQGAQMGVGRSTLLSAWGVPLPQGTTSGLTQDWTSLTRAPSAVVWLGSDRLYLFSRLD